jgi:hypothetical protein
MEDLMDFEYYLYRDEKKPASPEERELYLRTVKPVLDAHPEHKKDRRLVFKAWLDFRRRQENTARVPLSPGGVFRQIHGFFIFLCVITGFLTGTGLCFSFLTYQGREPLNVSSYLGIFVLSQIFILLAALLLFVSWKVLRREPSFSMIRFLLWTMMVNLMGYIGRKTSNHLTRETTIRFQAAWGLAKGKSRCYGDVFPFPLFILTQTFAVFFNSGIIAATLLKILGSDLAFGWQSTVQLSSDAVYALVRFVALPWSFVVNEPLAHPTLSQIEGTRLILKDGMTRLTTENLVSWWPFLSFSVLVYGLLPRLALLATAWTMEKRALGRIRFENTACDMLMLKLTHPWIETKWEPGFPGEGPCPSYPAGNSTERPAITGHPPFPDPDMAVTPFLVLLPIDIAGSLDDRELNDHLNAMFGTGFKEKIHVSMEARTDAPLLEHHIRSRSVRRVLCLMEAWQPPIRETAEFFRCLRDIGGESLRIHILLIGKPAETTPFTSPDPADVRVWQHTLDRLADTNIRLDIIADRRSDQTTAEEAP